MKFRKIKDVKIVRLKKIKDHRGSVLQMIKKNSKYFKKFGEIYFSTLNKNKKKGWNKHLKLFSNISCISGAVTMILFDDRKINKQFMKIKLSRNNYYLVIVPPKIWYGFINNFDGETIIANCSTLPHSKKEIVKRDLHDKMINFRWDRYE